MADEKQYWEVEYNDYFPDTVIKFKKLKSLDVLDLADRNIGKDGSSKQFKLDCLSNVVWSKNGTEWFSIVDEDGNCTLPDLPAATLLDIFFEYRSKVCMPVFTGSRAYQALKQESDRAKEAKKHENK